MTESTLEYIPIDWSQVATSNWIYQARFGETLDLSDSSIEFTVSIPDSYVTDAALELQVVVHAEDAANTDYGTHIVLSSLTKNDDGDYIIGRDTDLATAIGLGFQVSKAPADANLKDSIHIRSLLIKRPEGSAPVSSNSSSSSSSSSSSASNIIDIPMESTWRGNSGGTVAYVADGVEFTAAAKDQGAVFDIAGPVNWEGATLTFVINISQAYKDSSANLQPFAQTKDTWDGHWDCYLENAQLTAGTDQTVTCGPLGAAFNVSDAAGIQAGLQAPTAASGTVIIKSASVTLAE